MLFEEAPTQNTIPIEIWVDGACIPNPGNGGWGVLMVYKGLKQEFSGPVKDTTNNRMELTAAIKALSIIDKRSKIIIYSDSRYVIDGITKWIHGWLKTNKKNILNLDLWMQLHKLNNFHSVKWVWVKGHEFNDGNNRADELANTAATRRK